MPPRRLALLAEADARIARVWDPHVCADVNDAQVKVVKFGDRFDGHAHAHEDEAFLVLKGRIAIDLRDGAVEMEEGDLPCVPRGTEHRPRALTAEPVVLMFKPAATPDAGEARSRPAVAEPRRL